MRKLKHIIKTILVIYFKLLLVIIWGISLGLFSTMSYNPTLDLYSLGELKLYVILLFGNICCIPWLVLWCKRLSPAFNKPSLYYRTKNWIRVKKEEAFTYKIITLCLAFLVKVFLVLYLVILMGYIIILSIPFVLVIVSWIAYLIGP